MSKAVGSLKDLKAVDPEIHKAIKAEERRQRNKLLLIASENFASSAVIPPPRIPLGILIGHEATLSR